MNLDQETTIKQAVGSFLLSCKVAGKASRTVDCYRDKLKGFPWYATHYELPDDLVAITTHHARQFLAYLWDADHQWRSDNSEGIQTPSRMNRVSSPYAGFFSLKPTVRLPGPMCTPSVVPNRTTLTASLVNIEPKRSARVLASSGVVL